MFLQKALKSEFWNEKLVHDSLPPSLTLDAVFNSQPAIPKMFDMWQADPVAKWFNLKIYIVCRNKKKTFCSNKTIMVFKTNTVITY